MGNESMRDLLQKFSEKQTKETPKTEEIELNLGLSLGGFFGGKPNKENSLYRTSSTNACFTTREFTGDGMELSLARTSSLPVEIVEETRKRKGLQCLRELEDMKKRSDKLRSFGDENGGGVTLPTSQGSIGSQGSGSSGISELENQSGPNNQSESRSPASILPLPEQTEQKPMVVPCSKPKLEITTEAEIKNSLEEPKVLISCTRESEIEVMGEMPCVFTKGDGPKMKRIKGLLYKYKNGEEPSILCVCHGSFLSPAEFVKHAGGGDVAHPLRHIVVVPSPSSFL